MAWWWKRQSSQSSTDDVAQASERDIPRRAQRAPIPAQRDAEMVLESAEVTDRWDIIKQDIAALDPDFLTELDRIVADEQHTTLNRELTEERLVESLKRLSIRYLVDEGGSLLAMWERHIMQIRLEGPENDILVLRARAYQTLPSDWNDHAFRATNEWNRTRRFLKAYVGESTEAGRIPLYGETQLPLRPGLTDALLDEFIDCAAAVSGAYIDWLHDEGGVL
ncbi:MAG TPA: YbjN domain-containing protein [Stackebrandtia sp.]|jgi:hypothetical protein|uniref:YbjN domain-containing protein n=1 Tax=Stackebrandtia sp. TaxID=2023065 RepID=UPI002D22C776|nr:YbjN domain-containing protein [Stackebrandtia sp.]HZE38543.1 YbjN domain-containing protein [Stackebrandtia sp.]